LAAAKKEQQAKDAAGKTMAHESGQEAQQDQQRNARAPRNVQAGLSVVQPIDELHAAKMPRLGERTSPEAMATKADVSRAAKPNKAKMQVAPRMPQPAAISATEAPIALTAVTAMATGSEGAEGGAEESAAAAAAAAAAAVAMQLPMNDDAAAAKPASSRAHGVNPRSEQGRKNNNARNRARRMKRAEGQTGAPGKLPPETEA
jgi:hypothetical protein